MRRECEFRLFTFSFSGGPASDDLRGRRRTLRTVVLHPCKPVPPRNRRNVPPGNLRGDRGCEHPHGNKYRDSPNCSRRPDCCDDFHPDGEPSANAGWPHQKTGRIWHKPSHGWPGIAHGIPRPKPVLYPVSTPGRDLQGNGPSSRRFLSLRDFWSGPFPDHR